MSKKPPYVVVFEPGNDSRTNENPAIIEGRDGVLIAAWANKGRRHDNDVSNVIMVSHSEDGGKSWSEPIEAVPPSSINPTFIRAKNGDAVLIFNKNRSIYQDDCTIAFRRSSDNGLTWSQTTEVDLGPAVSIIVHNGIVLPNGEWLIAFQYDRSGQGEPFDWAKADYVGAVAISSDEGKMWHRYGEVEVPNFAHFPNTKSFADEPAVYQSGDRTLGMVLRTNNRRVYRAMSFDDGRTWSQARPINLSSDDSKLAVLQLRNGHIVLLWNNNELLDFTRRFPLMASLSVDGGRTWSFTRTIEDDPVSLDYPTVIESGGSLKIVYAYAHRQIRFVELTEDELKPRWTCINKGDGWSAGDGILHFAGGSEPEGCMDWLRWSKTVAFLPSQPGDFLAQVDFRLEADVPKEGAIGLFFAYQDESNWSAWICTLKDRAGIEQEAHWGNIGEPSYSRNISQTFFEAHHAQIGRWYQIRVLAHPGKVQWQLLDRASGSVLISASNAVEWQGGFLALGSRGAPVSFANAMVRPAVKDQNLS